MTALPTHILVTGGAGFIGSHAVELLLAQGHHVTVLDNLSAGSLENLSEVLEHPRFHFVKGDAKDALAPQLEAIPFGPFTHILHLSAQVSVARSIEQPIEDLCENYLATLQVIEFAKTLSKPRVVFASSAAVYGDGVVPSSELQPCEPLSPYGAHKFASEHALAVASRLGQLDSISLRFFNVFGPRQSPTSGYAGVISIFLDRATTNTPLGIFGEGDATRDFIYVGDLVRAIALALGSEISHRGAAYNLGTSQSTSVRQLAEAILEVTGSKSEIHHKPARPGDILHSRAQTERAFKSFGFKSEVSLIEGLRKTAQWFSRS